MMKIDESTKFSLEIDDVLDHLILKFLFQGN